MKKSSAPTTPRFVWSIAVSAILILGLLFVKPFLSVVVLGLLMAFIFHPMYDYLTNKLRSSGRSVLATTIISMIILIIPLIIVIVVTAAQAIKLADQLTNSSFVVNDKSLDETLTTLSMSINDKIESLIGVKDAISTGGVQDFVTQVVPKLANGVANTIISIASGIPSFFTMFILYLFIFTAGLSKGRTLVQKAKDLSPFDGKTNELYIDRMGAMAKAMIKGQMLIAVIQGFVTAGGLALVGLGEYFWFFGVLFTFLSFIPLGAGIITIPLGIIMILVGNFSGGALVLFNHFVIVTNIDNIIRPKVVPKNAQLPAALTILGAFAGVAAFGFVGVIYGPMIMIVITTTIESYIDYKKKIS